MSCAGFTWDVWDDCFACMSNWNNTVHLTIILNAKSCFDALHWLFSHQWSVCLSSIRMSSLIPKTLNSWLVMYICVYIYVHIHIDVAFCDRSIIHIVLVQTDRHSAGRTGLLFKWGPGHTVDNKDRTINLTLVWCSYFCYSARVRGSGGPATFLGF